TTRAQIAALMGANNFEFGGTAFSLYTDVDLKDPAHYAVYVHQDGLTLPDRDYYLDAKFSGPKAAFEAYVANLLGQIGWSDPKGSAKAVVAFETRLAQASWTKAQERDPVATYNKMTVAELAGIVADTPLATLKAWEAFRTVDDAAPDLSKSFADAYFELHNKTLSGQAEQAVRWKRGVLAVSGISDGSDRIDYFGKMEWAVGQLYTAKY